MIALFRPTARWRSSTAKRSSGSRPRLDRRAPLPPRHPLPSNLTTWVPPASATTNTLSITLMVRSTAPRTLASAHGPSCSSPVGRGSTRLSPWPLAALASPSVPLRHRLALAPPLRRGTAGVPCRCSASTTSRPGSRFSRGGQTTPKEHKLEKLETASGERERERVCVCVCV